MKPGRGCQSDGSVFEPEINTLLDRGQGAALTGPRGASAGPVGWDPGMRQFRRGARQLQSVRPEQFEARAMGVRSSAIFDRPPVNSKGRVNQLGPVGQDSIRFPYVDRINPGWGFDQHAPVQDGARIPTLAADLANTFVQEAPTFNRHLVGSPFMSLTPGWVGAAQTYTPGVFDFRTARTQPASAAAAFQKAAHVQATSFWAVESGGVPLISQPRGRYGGKIARGGQVIHPVNWAPELTDYDPDGMGLVKTDVNLVKDWTGLVFGAPVTRDEDGLTTRGNPSNALEFIGSGSFTKVKAYDEFGTDQGEWYSFASPGVTGSTQTARVFSKDQFAGRTTLWCVVNDSGVAISAGDIVKVDGYDFDEGLIKVTKVTAVTDKVMGVAAVDIADGATGDILNQGPESTGFLNTAAASDGDLIYFTAGAALTLTAGSKPIGKVVDQANNVIWIGAEVKANATTLDGPASATDNALVRFDGTTGDLVKSGNIAEDNSGNLTGIANINGSSVADLLINRAGTMSPESLAEILANDLLTGNGDLLITNVLGTAIRLANGGDGQYLSPETALGIAQPAWLDLPVMNLGYDTFTAAVATSTAIPTDNTLPQSTEGAELMTASITPRSASSTLVCFAFFFATINNASYATNAAFFRDSTADGFGASSAFCASAFGRDVIVVGGTQASTAKTLTTIKLRFGPSNAAASSRAGGSTSANLFSTTQKGLLLVLEVP